MQKLLISLLFIASMLAGGCVPYYRPDIQQGNVVSQEMVDKLRPGMSKHQVQYILGTPLLIDVFHQERWDYYYSFEGMMEARNQKRLSIFFENGRLARIAGDYRPKPKADPLAEGERELHTVPDYDERTKGVIRRTWDEWRDDDEAQEAEQEEVVSVPDQERTPEEEEKGLFDRMWDKVGLGDDEEETPVQHREQTTPGKEPVRLTRPREEDWREMDTPSAEESGADHPNPAAAETEEKGFFGRMWDKVGLGDDEEESPVQYQEQTAPEDEAERMDSRAGIQREQAPPVSEEKMAPEGEEAKEKGFFGRMWDTVSFGSDEEEAAAPEPQEQVPEPEESPVMVTPYRAGLQPEEPSAPASEEEPEMAPVEEAEPLVKEQTPEADEKGFFGSMWDKVGFGSDEEETPAEEAPTPDGAAPVEERSTGDEEDEEKGFFGSMWDKVGFGSDEEEEAE